VGSAPRGRDKGPSRCSRLVDDYERGCGDDTCQKCNPSSPRVSSGKAGIRCHDCQCDGRQNGTNKPESKLPRCALGDHVQKTARQFWSDFRTASGQNSTELAEATRPLMSAMPPIATKAVSRSETSLCAKTGHNQAHSITSSARPSNVNGKVRPSILAVSRRCGGWANIPAALSVRKQHERRNKTG
jgi:hypothetical protein